MTRADDGEQPVDGCRMTRLLLLLSLAACAQSTRDQATSPPADHSPDSANDKILRGWTASDSAALALGVGLLRQTPLPTEIQEVRIWSGLALGVPHDLLRHIKKKNEIDGVKAMYWEVERKDADAGAQLAGVPIDAIVRHTIEGRCGPPKRYGNVEACWVVFTKRPHWKAMWDSLEVLGVWSLPDQDDLPDDGSMTLDGWAMTVEVRRGNRYRSYAYSNPDGRRHPAQVAAAAIGRIDDSVWSLVPRPRNERRYRGRLDVGVGWSEFRACGSGTIWGVQGRLGNRLDSLRMKVAGQDSTARHVYYAELRGMLAYPGLARYWNTPYAEILEVDSVFTVRASSPERC